MTESTKNRRSDPRTPEAEEMVDVFLRRSVARRGGPFYGPGQTKVPRSLYESLKLSPDLVATDGAGNPLPNTVAASVLGGGTSTVTERDAHPTVARDPETGDAIEDDDESGPQSEVARRAAEIAENAEQGPDRQGGQLAGESGSLDQKRELQALPGQEEPTRQQVEQLDADRARDEASGNGGGSGGGGSSGGRKGGTQADAKPLTKTELREMDEDVLVDLARRNRVAVPKKGGKKALVDKLYDARVTLD